MVFDGCTGYLEIKTSNAAPVLDITLYDYIKSLTSKEASHLYLRTILQASN